MRTIFAQPDAAHVHRQLAEVASFPGARASRHLVVRGGTFHDLLAQDFR